jgi:hypothetical protein
VISSPLGRLMSARENSPKLYMQCFSDREEQRRAPDTSLLSC